MTRTNPANFRAKNKLTKPAPGMQYQLPTGSDAFWTPEDAKTVSNLAGWGILGVEQNPDGSVIVTFGDGSGDDGPGRIFEMALPVVTRLAATLQRNGARSVTRAISDWF